MLAFLSITNLTYEAGIFSDSSHVYKVFKSI
jgi:hypothetical protein